MVRGLDWVCGRERVDGGARRAGTGVRLLGGQFLGHGLGDRKAAGCLFLPTPAACSRVGVVARRLLFVKALSWLSRLLDSRLAIPDLKNVLLVFRLVPELLVDLLLTLMRLLLCDSLGFVKWSLALRTGVGVLVLHGQRCAGKGVGAILANLVVCGC